MIPRERAERWLAEKMRQQFIGPFEAAETLDDLMLRLGVIAADAIERVLADYRYDLWSTMESWASERSHAATNERDSVERAAFLGSKYAHSTDATYVRKSDVPWAAVIDENQAP